MYQVTVKDVTYTVENYSREESEKFLAQHGDHKLAMAFHTEGFAPITVEKPYCDTKDTIFRVDYEAILCETCVKAIATSSTRIVG